MKTENIIEQPPTNKTDSHPGEAFIYVRLKLRDLPGFVPEGAWLPTIVMKHLLGAQMQLHGVKVTTSLGAGAFNDSVYLLNVDRLAVGLEAARVAIESVFLSSVAEIGWIDVREQIIRIEQPVKTTRALPFDEIDTINNASVEFMNEIVKRAKIISRKE